MRKLKVLRSLYLLLDIYPLKPRQVRLVDWVKDSPWKQKGWWITWTWWFLSSESPLPFWDLYSFYGKPAILGKVYTGWLRFLFHKGWFVILMIEGSTTPCIANHELKLSKGTSGYSSESTLAVCSPKIPPNAQIRLQLVGALWYNLRVLPPFSIETGITWVWPPSQLTVTTTGITFLR